MQERGRALGSGGLAEMPGTDKLSDLGLCKGAATSQVPAPGAHPTHAARCFPGGTALPHAHCAAGSGPGQAGLLPGAKGRRAPRGPHTSHAPPSTPPNTRASSTLAHAPSTGVRVTHSHTGLRDTRSTSAHPPRPLPARHVASQTRATPGAPRHAPSAVHTSTHASPGSLASALRPAPVAWRRWPRPSGVGGGAASPQTADPPGGRGGLALSTCVQSMLPRPPQQSGPAAALLIGAVPGPRASQPGTASGWTTRGPRASQLPPGPAPLRPRSAACRGAFPVTLRVRPSGKCSSSCPLRAPSLALARRLLEEPGTTSPRTAL